MVDTIRPLSELLSAAGPEQVPADSGRPAAPAATDGRSGLPVSPSGGTPASADAPGGKPAPNSSAAAAAGKKLYVRIPSEEDPVLRRISLILTMFPGSDSLVIWCEKERKRLGARCLLHEGLLLELGELLGKENVVLK